jgi:hypothetical protein
VYFTLNVSLLKTVQKDSIKVVLVAEMSEKQSRVVEAPCGPVQGRTFTFENGREASAFQGIPFAKPPIGELRFKVTINQSF